MTDYTAASTGAALAAFVSLLQRAGALHNGAGQDLTSRLDHLCYEKPTATLDTPERVPVLPHPAFAQAMSEIADAFVTTYEAANHFDGPIKREARP